MAVKGHVYETGVNPTTISSCFVFRTPVTLGHWDNFETNF